MKIGSIHEGWIGQRPKIKPYIRWGCMWPCMEPSEDTFVPCSVHCISSANSHVKDAHMSSPYLVK